VRRHTRVDEESGRAELMLSTVVGTSAPLAAAVIEACGTALLTGLLTALANTAAGVDLAGSLTFGAAWASLGLVATGMAAVAVQLSASARTSSAIVAVALGLAYVLRAVGDVAVPWLSWLSPFGWASKMEPYAGDRWAVVAMPLILTVSLLGLSVLLRDRRDLGSGLISPRPGPAHSPLGSFPALLVRLMRGSYLGWVAGVTALGAVLGGIAGSAGKMLDSGAARQMMERLGGKGAVEDIFLAAEISILAVIVTAWTITVVTRMAAEESVGRAEVVLAAASPRGLVFVTAAVGVLVGSAILLLTFGLGAGISYGLQGGGVGHELGRLVPAALVQAPAVWVVAALAILAWSLGARWGFLGWVLLATFLLLGQIGELLELPQAVIDLSPYAHAPGAPAESVVWGVQAALVGIAAVVLGGAWARYRTRDIG